MISTNTWERNTGEKQHDPIDAATWIRPNGKVQRQIAYIAISQKYSNFVRTTYTVRNWRGNMEQQTQLAVIRMGIKLRFGKHYFYKTAPETGTELNYNIKHAKNNQNYSNNTYMGAKYA